jgi:hypothetical protein
MISTGASKNARRIGRILCKPKKHVINHFKPSGKIEVGNLTSRPACARAVVMGSLHA